jgi:hypothetical protein
LRVVIEVTINTVYATLFIYPLLEDIICILPEDGSTEPKHVTIKRTSPNKGYIKSVAYTVFIVTSMYQKFSELLVEKAITQSKRQNGSEMTHIRDNFHWLL